MMRRGPNRLTEQTCSPSLAARGAALLVRAYQLLVSPLKQVLFGTTCSCRFQPTCSCFARTALLRFGLFRGSWLAVMRILKCHPWHAGGYDPVPDLKSTAPTGISTNLTTNLDG
jgi:putative membrane protein insertion efficiency factor